MLNPYSVLLSTPVPGALGAQRTEQPILSLPPGYNPMKKQGAIILGSGGDCCATGRNLSAGTFYEGAMVAGYPSDATENAVQANIVAAGYGATGTFYTLSVNKAGTGGGTVTATPSGLSCGTTCSANYASGTSCGDRDCSRCSVPNRFATVRA